jgi:hypothetical protein
MEPTKAQESFRPTMYLGDSVYVRPWNIDPECLVLYLDNGEGPHNEIVLEPEVLEEFIRYERGFREWKLQREDASTDDLIGERTKS